MHRMLMTRAVVVVAVVCASSVSMIADVAPREGDVFPRAYYLRRARDPRAFTFRRSYLQQVERIRSARSSLMGRVAALSAAEASAQVIASANEIAVRGKRYDSRCCRCSSRIRPAKPFQEPALEARLFGTTGQHDDGLSTLRTRYGLLRGRRARCTRWHRPARATTRCTRARTFSIRVQLIAVQRHVRTAPSCRTMLKLGVWRPIDASVDFRQLDNDGPDGVPNSGDDDGYADFVAFVHPEKRRRMRCRGERRREPEYLVAPLGTSQLGVHRSSRRGTSASSGAKIKVDDYVITPAFDCDGTRR